MVANTGHVWQGNMAALGFIGGNKRGDICQNNFVEAERIFILSWISSQST